MGVGSCLRQPCGCSCPHGSSRHRPSMADSLCLHGNCIRMPDRCAPFGMGPSQFLDSIDCCTSPPLASRGFRDSRVSSHDSELSRCSTNSVWSSGKSGSLEFLVASFDEKVFTTPKVVSNERLHPPEMRERLWLLLRLRWHTYVCPTPNTFGAARALRRSFPIYGQYAGILSYGTHTKAYCPSQTLAGHFS
jgi:hypothetical protein